MRSFPLSLLFVIIIIYSYCSHWNLRHIVCIVSGPCLDATAFCLFNLFYFWRLFKFIIWGKLDVPGLCHLCQVTDFTGPWNKVWQFQHLFKSDGVNLNITGWIDVVTQPVFLPLTFCPNPILHHPHQRLIRLPSSMTAANLGECWS